MINRGWSLFDLYDGLGELLMLFRERLKEVESERSMGRVLENGVEGMLFVFS